MTPMRELPTWSSDVATIWRYYVPPCRPSWFDLQIVTDIVAEFRARCRRNPRLAILGSTTEFRDWAFREQLAATVIDNSAAYHSAVSAELTHPVDDEEVVLADWRWMDLRGFDLVVGDLVSGQLPVAEISIFLSRVRAMMEPEGTFVTKSFFRRDPQPSFEQLANLCRSKSDHVGDIFPEIIYPLAQYSVGADSILHFERMLGVVDQLRTRGALTADQHARLHQFGWDTNFKVHFTMPSHEFWQTEVESHFDKWETRNEPRLSWSADIPTYIITNPKSEGK